MAHRRSMGEDEIEPRSVSASAALLSLARRNARPKIRGHGGPRAAANLHCARLALPWAVVFCPFRADGCCNVCTIQDVICFTSNLSEASIQRETRRHRHSQLRTDRQQMRIGKAVAVDLEDFQGACWIA